MTYEINETKKAKEDAFFDKWMKEREDKGVSLKKRIIGREKEGGKKIVKKKKVTKTVGKSGEEEVREGEDMEEGDDSKVAGEGRDGEEGGNKEGNGLKG